MKEKEAEGLELSFLQAALNEYHRGFAVVPIIPGTKQTAVKWDSHLEGLCEQAVRNHWAKHPDHELGCILLGDLIVLDADSPESVSAVNEIEKAFDTTSGLIVKTTRGEHHWYRAEAGVHVKTRAVSTKENPSGIDIKASRSLVVMPPSTGKSNLIDEIEHVNELTVVSQDFIDAVYRHNKWQPYRPAEPSPFQSLTKHGADLKLIEALLEHVDPDTSYDEWLHCGMAISHETGNSEEGFELWNRWSAMGHKYPDEDELRAKWRSYDPPPNNPITVATLIKLAREGGADTDPILGSVAEDFEIEGDTTVEYANTPTLVRNPLTRYSLTGTSADLKKRLRDAVFVLKPIALLGQATVIYASPNTGKTLAVLVLSMDSIAEGRIEPTQVYYVNADDNLRGLTEKVRIAERLGFHVLADGYHELRTTDVLAAMVDMTGRDTADGIIIILDTMKRFTDLMNKRVASEFTGIVRRFVAKGGTVIALAHTNKRRREDGKPIYAGTSDAVDDFDCGYLADLIDDGASSGRRAISFENIKARGPVAQIVHFSYLTPQQAGSYEAMLESFAELDPEDADQLIEVRKASNDEPLIATVLASLREGPASKKDLLVLLRDAHDVSRAVAAQLIERYCGDDPDRHKWNFERGERGKHQYKVLEAEPPTASNPDLLSHSVWATPAASTRGEEGSADE